MAASEFWGQNPFTTTVLASPTPTASQFTVDNAVELVQGQWILVEVDGEFERTKITGLAASQLTVSPALSQAPDVPGELRSGRTLVRNTLLNQGAVFHADTPADLGALNAFTARDGLKYFSYAAGIYSFQKTSYSADGWSVVNNSSGQWILEVGSGWSRQFSDSSELKQIDTGALKDPVLYTAVIKSALYIRNYVWISSGSATESEPVQYTPDSGPGYWQLISQQALGLRTSSNFEAINQSGHGFAVGEQIRLSSGTWVKAQGNSIINCTNVWTVVQFIDVNNFVAVKEGRVTCTGHGLGAANTLLYLSPAVAGGLASAKPIGTPSTPLGFSLPVIFIESTDVIHVLGKSTPEIDSVLSHYDAAVSGDLQSATTFALDLANYAGRNVWIDAQMTRHTNTGAGFTAGPAFSWNITGSTATHTAIEHMLLTAATPTWTMVKSTNVDPFYGRNSASTTIGIQHINRVRLGFIENQWSAVNLGNRWFMHFFESETHTDDQYRFRSAGSQRGDTITTGITVTFAGTTQRWELRQATNDYFTIKWDGPA